MTVNYINKIDVRSAMEYEFLKKQEYGLSYIQENIEMVVYTAVCFFVPFFIGHPQLVVGVIVNAALVLGALNLRSYKMLPVIMAPSLGVLSKGLLFGSFTVFLVYMVPFIWIGNSILVYAFKKMYVHKKVNRWLTLLTGALAKMVFLFLAAFVLVKMGVLPAPFLTAMGIFQFYTAVTGGFIAFGVHALKKRI